MTDMIERVARAICKSRSCHGIQCCEWPANTGLRHKCTVVAGYGDAARAAIEAMREPTLKMRLAGRRVKSSWLAENEEIEIWQNMIDEALK